MMTLKISQIKELQRPPRLKRINPENPIFRCPTAKLFAHFVPVGEYPRGSTCHALYISKERTKAKRGKEIKPKGYARDSLTLPFTQNPWSSDGQHLVLKYWGKDAILYHTERRSVQKLPFGTAPFWFMECSRTGPSLFIVKLGKKNNACFISLQDKPTIVQKFSLPTDDAFYFWTAEGKVLALRQDKSVAMLELYSPGHKQPIGSASLDLAELLPYDRSIWKLMKRDENVLLHSWGTTVGFMLDLWSGAHFDADKNFLYLGALRPSEEPKQRKDRWSGDGNKQWGCRVKMRWIQVKIG